MKSTRTGHCVIGKVVPLEELREPRMLHQVEQEVTNQRGTEYKANSSHCPERVPPSLWQSLAELARIL